jgi:prepilin-type N-terminal cleavage/methylation domain-containing protein
MTRRGYTLFELMLVLAVIVIVASIASPLVFQGLHSEGKVDAAADMVRARWADCRSHAIEEGRPYCFRVIPNTGKFKIQPYDPSSEPGGGDMSTTLGGQTTTAPDGSPSGVNGTIVNSGAQNTVFRFMDYSGNPVDSSSGVVIEDVLPQGVRFGTQGNPVDPNSAEPTGGDYVTIAVFLPDGTAMEDVEVTFGGKGASNPITLKLRGLTGASVRVPPGEGGNQ